MCPLTEGLVSDSMGGLGEWDRAGFELCGESGSGPGPCEPCDFCSGISASLSLHDQQGQVLGSHPSVPLHPECLILHPAPPTPALAPDL